ncbi:MAG: PAS domain S-box protein [Chloroflexota bacterium]
MLFLLLERFGLVFEYQSINIATIWPFGGIVLAGLLMTRRRSWFWILPLVFFANLGVCVWKGDNLALSLGFALINCGESLLIAYLLQHYTNIDQIFDRVSCFFQYYLIISVGSASTAFLGAALVVSASGQDFWQVWLSWWFAHGLGIAVLIPLFLAFIPNKTENGKNAKDAAWAFVGSVSLQSRLGINIFKSTDRSISALLKSVIHSIKSSQLDLKKMVEGLLVVVAVQIAVCIIFLSSQKFLAESVLRSYIIFPFLIWFGLRFDRRLVTLLLTFISAVAILGTLNGLGMFAERDFSVLERLQAVQLFLGVLVIVTLAPGTVRREFIRASDKLVKSEADFRGLFEHASIGIFHFRPGDGFLMVNPSLAAMLGYRSPQELIDATKQLFTDPRQFEDWFQEKQTGKDGWVQQLTSFQRQDGSSLLVKLSMRKVTIPDGGLAYLEGFVEDISEQKKAEDALLETTREFRSIVEASPTAKHFYRLTENGSLLLTGANPAAERLLGCNHIDLIDQPIEGCLPGLANDDFVELCRQVALGSLSNQSFEKHVSPATDQVGLNGYFEVHIFETRPGLIAIDLVDISARKLSEQVSRARLKLLELSDKHSLEHLLQATLDEAEAMTGSQIGFYHFVEEDQNTLSLQTWSTRTLAQYCHAEGQGSHYPVDKAGVWVDCIKQRAPVIHNHYETLQHRQGLPVGHASLERELVVPVMRGDKVVSLLGMGNKLSDYSAQDVDVVSHLADLAWDITQRKRAELSLQKSETLLNETQSIAKVGGWEFSLTSNRITWTREVYQIYGLTLDFDPNNWDAQLSFYREADREILSQAYGNAIGNGQAFDLELGLINNLKQELWVRTLASPVIENGKVVKVNGTIVDVSELKKAQAALALSEEQLRLSMEASNDGIWDWRIKENKTYFSLAYTRMLGYTQEDFPAEHWIALVHPDNQ